MKKLLLIAIIVSTGGAVMAQKIDTVRITGALLHTDVLKDGEHQWLVYFKNGKDSSRVKFSIWNRRIDRIRYHDKDAIAITQRWESNDTVTHSAYSVVDRKTFAPMYHEVWWKGNGKIEFDYSTKIVKLRGEVIKLPANEGRTKLLNTFINATAADHLIWHLDLETFPLLPYKDNTAFVINFYDPGFGPPEKQVYTVIGSGSLPGYNGQQIECWKLAHGKLPENYEVFWINKKTKEVMKLDQEFAGKYRYKVLLPFTN